MKADLVDISFTRTGRTRFTVETTEDVTELFDRLKDLPVSVEIKQWKEKRSLDANAYYWRLLSEVAAKLQISKPRAHNMLLRKYGAVESFGEQMVILHLPENEEAQEQALESEYYHIKPTSQVKEGKDGKMYRTYIMMKGSHDYNTAEMSALINGLVDECNQMGIETKSPEEIKSMMEAYSGG